MPTAQTNSDNYLVSEWFAKANVSKSWQFRTVFNVAKLNAWQTEAENYLEKAFVTNLIGSINKGMRGYMVKQIEMPGIWDGEKASWQVGNYPIDYIKELDNFDRRIVITFQEDQKLFVGRLAHNLRRCIQNHEGIYYPYIVQRPLDIVVRMLTNDGSLVGTFTFRSCGLMSSDNYKLNYGSSDLNTLTLAFLYEQLEVTFDRDLQVYGNDLPKWNTNFETAVESLSTVAADRRYNS